MRSKAAASSQTFNAGLRCDFSSMAWRAGSKKISLKSLSAGGLFSLLASSLLLFLFIAVAIKLHFIIYYAISHVNTPALQNIAAGCCCVFFS